MHDGAPCELAGRQPACWIFTLAWILAILAALMLVVAAPFGDALSGFISGAFGGRRLAYLMATLSRATLIVGMAISVLLSFRAGLFNIGGEGQLVAGGLVSALTAILLPGPPLMVLLAALLAGMVAGMLWALLAGVLYVYVGVPLLVGSLLLNFPIRYIASYLVAHPFRDVQRHAAIASRAGRHMACLSPGGPTGRRHPLRRRDQHLGGHLQPRHLAWLPGAAERPLRRVCPHRRPPGPTSRPADARAERRHRRAGRGAGGVWRPPPLHRRHARPAALCVDRHHRRAAGRHDPLAGSLLRILLAAIQTGAAGMERTAGVPKEIALVMQAVIILFVASRVSGALLSSQNRQRASDDGS